MLNDQYSGALYGQLLDLKDKPSQIYHHFFFSDVWKKNYDIKDFKKKS